MKKPPIKTTNSLIIPALDDNKNIVMPYETFNSLQEAHGQGYFIKNEEKQYQQR